MPEEHTNVFMGHLMTADIGQEQRKVIGTLIKVSQKKYTDAFTFNGVDIDETTRI